MLEPANWGLGTLHIHLCRHAHRGDPCHPLQGMMATPCCTVLTPMQVARTRKGGLRCTSWTCLEGIMAKFMDPTSAGAARETAAAVAAVVAGAALLA